MKSRFLFYIIRRRKQNESTSFGGKHVCAKPKELQYGDTVSLPAPAPAYTPEQQRRRNGLRCVALFLRLRTAPRTGLRPRAGWLRLRARAPTLRAAFGSRAARAAGPPAGGFAPFFLRGGERRTTPKICRLTKAARCAILHLDDRRKFALRRPEIGAYAEISRAFRCVYRVFTTNGAQISGCHAFCTEFCRCFHPVSARIRILPTQPRVSPELRAAHREGRPPSAHPLRRGHRAAVLSDKWKHSTT